MAASINKTISTLTTHLSWFASRGHRYIHRTSFYRRENVIKETDGPVTIIGINRPDKKNAVNARTADDIREKFLDFENNPSQKIAVLYGCGDTFCAGYDLNEVKNSDEKQLENIRMKNDGPMGYTRTILKKPVIAAVEGHAVAGGLELAIMCDLRVAGEGAVFGVYCRRYGVPLIDGGTIRLPALIGLSRAMDLILTGRGVKATEALEIGLINRLVPTGTALEQSIQLAHQLSELPQACMNSDRMSAYNAVFSKRSLQQLFQDEAEYGKLAFQDETIKWWMKTLEKY